MIRDLGDAIPPNFTSPTDRSALRLANLYLHDQEEAGLTIKRLMKKGPFGLMVAGEIALEEVSKRGPSYVSTWMSRAAQLYRKSINANPTDSPRLHIGTKSKAATRLAQYRIYEDMYAKERLPEKPLVEGSYKKLVSQGASYVDLLRGTYLTDRTKGPIELRGHIGEVAVLLLAQRYTLQSIGCEEWLPLQSLFREDHGGDCEKQVDEPTWDISILTQMGRNEKIETSYKIQVKSSAAEVTENPEVTVVRLADIALTEDDYRIPEKIIRGCKLELDQSEGLDRVTEELDARTEKLLDILG